MAGHGYTPSTKRKKRMRRLEVESIPPSRTFPHQRCRAHGVIRSGSGGRVPRNISLVPVNMERFRHSGAGLDASPPRRICGKGADGFISCV